MNYKNFGVLISCASNGVMKVDSVKRLIDHISKMDYNLLELSIDDIYKIESEPYFGYLRGGYTRDEIREMDAYARAKGVELVPTIQTLAHLTNLVKIPRFSEIVDVDDILLIDAPGTYELIDKMFASIAESFSTRKVNIGFDEAFKVGLGKYLDKHGYTNRFELLLKHLKKVVEIAEKYGFQIHMWSDMFFRLANHGEYYGKGIHIPQEVREQVPENVGICYWDYYTDDEELYDEMMKSHLEFDREFWFAGGAWCWNGFAPHNRLTLKNMLPAMKQVRNHKVENVLVTIWGDDGNDCSYFSVLPSLYAVRRFADGVYDEAIIKKEFAELFGVDFDDFMMLDLPNQNRWNPQLDKIDNSCKSLLFNDCFLGKKDYDLKEVWPIPYEEYATTLSQIGERMGPYAYLFENLSALCHVLEKKAALGLRTRAAYQAEDKEALVVLAEEYEETAERISGFRDTLRRVWMTDNKPYGWDIHEIRLGGLKARMQDGAQRLREYLKGECENIPELEEELLSYGAWDSQYNLYRGFVTVSQL